MNQDEATREQARPLEQAVEQQGQALERIKDALPHAGPRDRGLQQAIEEAGQKVDETKRELGRQDTGTLPKSSEDAESPRHEPIGGLG